MTYKSDNEKQKAKVVMKKVAVLFAMKDSIYKTFQECDVYDVERDALTYPGGLPIIAHPPCRLWSRMRSFSTAPIEEKQLAVWAVEQVRKNGGVLEHPSSSALWKEMNLPLGKERDRYGGFTMSVNQFWWGHKARKKTWLYVCGIEPAEIPAYPLKFQEPAFVVTSSMRRKGMPGWKPRISKKERLQTPVKFAEWLIELAKKM